MNLDHLMVDEGLMVKILEEPFPKTDSTSPNNTLLTINYKFSPGRSCDFQFISIGLCSS